MGPAMLERLVARYDSEPVSDLLDRAIFWGGALMLCSALVALAKLAA
jgi:hypothetical protein